MPIVERKQYGNRIRHWTSDRGALRVEIPRPHLLVFLPKGHLEAEFVDLFQEVVEESLLHHRPHLFWYGDEMTGYDSEFRERIGKYCVSVKDRVSAMNVYTPHRIVAMGAAVINVWLGGFFNIVKTRAQLDELLTQARVEEP